MMPDVSIIVPTKNSARTIESCLQSIKRQAHAAIELIVVDNSSTDSTAAIARRYADSFLIQGPERSSQRNVGARSSEGDYLLFIDSDMILDPDVVAQCMTTIGGSTAPALIIPEISIGDGFWAKCRALERDCYSNDDSVESARFYRRSAFDDAGGYDERLVAFEDWDLSLRVSRGTSLPRISSLIVHDEGRIKLSSHLAKKRYYAASFVLYRQKHRKTARDQANLLFRPAFARNWKRLVRHPGLTTGIMSLKTLELCAGLMGIYLDRGGKLRSSKPTAPSSTLPS
jgi:glycosyltransferase involved in cell wall biosynthesis